MNRKKRILLLAVYFSGISKLNAKSEFFIIVVCLGLELKRMQLDEMWNSFFGSNGGEFWGNRKGSSMNILKNTVWSTMSNGHLSI